MASVDVSVEALQENKIHEVAYDGREIYVKPLSMSESLTKLAHKIDFSQDDEEGEGTASEAQESEESKDGTTSSAAEKAKLQPSLWPWDSVRNKLKSSLTECSVLLDVIQVSKMGGEKKYMMLDPVQQEAPEQKNGVQLLAKKRCLASAGTILSSGADRLKRSQEQISKKTTPDFHHELTKLRNMWRLKKVGNIILGDLSYKSAGSRFYQNGTFEVRKSENEATAPEVVTMSGAPKQRPSALQVTVPAELEGISFVQVCIKRISDSSELVKAEYYGDVLPATAMYWQNKLQSAQNVIFCKEIFAQLAREATQLQSKIPHVVVGNHIYSHLFPGLQLSIALCHRTTKGKSKRPPRPSPRLDQDQVLEHSIHQLLRELHMRNTYHPMPHPVTALIGMSKRRRIAGPQALSRVEMVEPKVETLLEQIVRQAQHIIIRQRTIDVIDDVAAKVKDPVVTAHWSNLSSATEAMIKMHITALGYESVRTPFSIHINVDKLRAITRDGKVINLSSEEQELRDFLMNQIASHHINTMMHVGKWMDWTTLSINTHVGVGDMEETGNAHTLMLASPRGDRVISIKSGPSSGLKIYLQRCPAPETVSAYNGVVTHPKWLNLGGPFEEIKLDRVEGRNFANKMETFMACTANLNIHTS